MGLNAIALAGLGFMACVVVATAVAPTGSRKWQKVLAYLAGAWVLILAGAYWMVIRDDATRVLTEPLGEVYELHVEFVDQPGFQGDRWLFGDREGRLRFRIVSPEHGVVMLSGALTDGLWDWPYAGMELEKKSEGVFVLTDKRIEASWTIRKSPPGWPAWVVQRRKDVDPTR